MYFQIGIDSFRSKTFTHAGESTDYSGSENWSSRSPAYQTYGFMNDPLWSIRRASYERFPEDRFLESTSQVARESSLEAGTSRVTASDRRRLRTDPEWNFLRSHDGSCVVYYNGISLTFHLTSAKIMMNVPAHSIDRIDFRIAAYYSQTRTLAKTRILYFL